MSHRYEYDRPDQIQQYKGIPHKQDQKEASVWKKFISFVLPWIAKKWDLGNAYLEARVAREVNEAKKVAAETMLLEIQAATEIKKIIDLAEKEDVQNSEEFTGEKACSDAEIEREMEELKEKIRLMHLKYRFRISISLDESKTKTPSDAGESRSQSDAGESKSKPDFEVSEETRFKALRKTSDTGN